MIFYWLIAIVALIIMLFELSKHLYFAKKKHEHILKLKSPTHRTAALLHNHQHVAGSVLLFAAGSLVLLGLSVYGWEHFLLHVEHDADLESYLMGTLGTLFIGVIFYVHHLILEEQDTFPY